MNIEYINTNKRITRFKDLPVGAMFRNKNNDGLFLKVNNEGLNSNHKVVIIEPLQGITGTKSGGFSGWSDVDVIIPVTHLIVEVEDRA